MALNQQALDTLLNQFLADLGGAFSLPLVRLGDALGLYKTLHAQGPMTSVQLAEKTGLTERYLREWLSAQAASNYIAYDADSESFSLPFLTVCTIWTIQGGPWPMFVRPLNQTGPA